MNTTRNSSAGWCRFHLHLLSKTHKLLLCLIHLTSTILILVCSSFITKIICIIKSDTLECQNRALLMLLNLEELFYHCSITVVGHLFLFLVYPENTAWKKKNLIRDLVSGPWIAWLLGTHQNSVFKVGKKPGVQTPRSIPRPALNIFPLSECNLLEHFWLLEVFYFCCWCWEMHCNCYNLGNLTESWVRRKSISSTTQ